MSTQGDYLTGIADAIRAKEGSSDPIPANTFAERIAQITTGYDTSDATAQASHILSPYTAYGASGKITGTIPSQAGKTITPGTAQQTAISSGTYASGNILVAGDANLKAQNIKSGVSIFGVNGALLPLKSSLIRILYGLSYDVFAKYTTITQDQIAFEANPPSIHVPAYSLLEFRTDIPERAGLVPIIEDMYGVKLADDYSVRVYGGTRYIFIIYAEDAVDNQIKFSFTQKIRGAP